MNLKVLLVEGYEFIYPQRKTNSPVNWDVAEKFCQDEFGGHLPSFHSKKQFDAFREGIKELAVVMGLASTPHIPVGGKRKATSGDRYNQFYWVDGSQTDWKYPWRSNEPNNLGGRENVIHLWEGEINHMNDVKITNNLFTIWGCSRRAPIWTTKCEKFKGSGRASLYKFYKFDKTKTWAQAETFCRNIGGRLPSFHSQKEWDMFVRTSGQLGLTKQYHGVPVGGKRIGPNAKDPYIWIDGTPMDWKFSWANGQPDNYAGREYLLELFETSGRMNDFELNRPRYYGWACKIECIS
eukprot:TRINITY_DN6422_c0_g1_i4.p1 TRINITY_DN6422_c0_g1~~TRINITY_DN6422_c0_g1_i4.p1  ORF type:complete len:320 (-),score=30.36 TRINITY_DN6422_c0_g1_i4:133-1014(-)